MRTHHVLPLLLLVPACGDDIKPADLGSATPQQLAAAVKAASGRQAFGAADELMAMSAGGGGCPSVEVRTDGSVVITGECGEYQGYAVIEPSLTDVRISTDGFGDATGTITGTIVVALDRSALDVDVDVRADVDLVTHLAITCAPGGLCQPEPGSWLELAALGRVDVIGAWRPEPAGGFLTLIGLQTLTLDFNAGGDCTPYTLDGLPAGCL